MSQRQLGQGDQSGPALRPPRSAGAVPDRSGPQGVAGSGDTERGSAEGLGWKVRVPHPASPAPAAAPPEGEGGQPEGGGRVPGGPTAWGRRGSPGPHVCALPGGGVPGRARAAVRGGRGVPRTPSLLLLPPRPPLPLPSSCAVPSSARAGGSARRVRSGRALREAGAPGGGGGGRDGGGGGGAGRETLPLCALRPGGGGQAALPSPASRPWRKNTRRNCSLSSAPTTPYLLTSCLGPGWVRVKNPPGQDDPFSGDCCWCPSPDPGPQQVGEWPPTEPDQTAAEEVKRG
ncbi:uncharacterized protein LOC144333727 isoform X2 [Macaca mulatta]